MGPWKSSTADQPAEFRHELLPDRFNGSFECQDQRMSLVCRRLAIWAPKFLSSADLIHAERPSADLVLPIHPTLLVHLVTELCDPFLPCFQDGISQLGHGGSSNFGCASLFEWRERKDLQEIGRQQQQDVTRLLSVGRSVFGEEVKICRALRVSLPFESKLKKLAYGPTKLINVVALPLPCLDGDRVVLGTVWTERGDFQTSLDFAIQAGNLRFAFAQVGSGE